MAVELEVGSKAPDFTGEMVKRGGATTTATLASLLEGASSIVVYFYPKDETPGCTTQACSFRDLYKEFEAVGSRVVGISPDTAASHIKFAENHALPFPLIADPDHAIAESFGAWKEKKNYGKVYMGIERSTYVLDKSGIVVKIFPRVKVDQHAEKVLAVVKGIV